MIGIIVIGETCIDKFVYCDAKRLSPEAPVPVLTPVETITGDGMSGNAAKNLTALDRECSITHWHQGQEITKTRFIDKKSNHMFLRVDTGEEAGPVDAFKLTGVKRHILEYADIVVVSDYNKGFLSDEDLLQIGKGAKLSILDSKRVLSREIAESFTWVKLNEGEASRNPDLAGLENIIVTLGAQGVRHKGQAYPSPSPKETIDVSGAGDTFTSAFILNYFKTGEAYSSLIYANGAAASVVSKRGVATP